MVIQVIVGVAHFFSSKNQLKFIKPKRVFSSIGQIIRNVILSCVGILGFLIVLVVALGLIIGAVTNKSTYGVPLTIFCVIILVGLLVESFLKYRKEQQK